MIDEITDRSLGYQMLLNHFREKKLFLFQWLGNVVTCKWWSDIWLQEGMATYHQHEAVGYALPHWDMVTLCYLALNPFCFFQ